MLKKRYPILFAFLLFGLSHFHNDVLFNWADEGFLWLGARMTLEGLTPILDFQSYDPGRYYWCAAVMRFLGDGLLTVRFAAELFQLMGLMLGLLALRRVIKTPLALLGAGLVAFMWMLMPFRYFDSNMALIAIFFAVRLAEEPTAKRFWAAGAFTSLAAFFGANHGLYAFLSFGLLTICLYVKNKIPLKNISYYVGGVICGLIPFGSMCVLVPGFRSAYFQKLPIFLSMLREGRTNAPYPIVWPWMVRWDDPAAAALGMTGKILTYLNHTGVGLYFIFVVLLVLVASKVIYGIKKVSTPAAAMFVSASCVAAGSFHGTLSRPDVFHVADGVFPVWVTILSLFAMSGTSALKIWARVGIGLFVVISITTAGLVNNVTFKVMTPVQYMVRYPVGQDQLLLTKNEAATIEGLKRFIADHVGLAETLLMAPAMTTFYGVLDKQSPTYEMYFVMPVSEEAEARNLRDLEANQVNWAMVADYTEEGSVDHRLSRTHPRLWGYLSDHFEDVSSAGMPDEFRRLGYRLMRRDPAKISLPG